MKKEFGYVYILSNPIFIANIYKIGHTTQTVEERVKEIYKTGVPVIFKIELAKYVKFPEDVEKDMHRDFYYYRINKKREFFLIDLVMIKKYLDNIPGIYTHFDGEQIPNYYGEFHVLDRQMTEIIRT